MGGGAGGRQRVPGRTNGQPPPVVEYKLASKWGGVVTGAGEMRLLG